ncbi:hypothetical protein [Halobacillus massiliensis]|uniref:hypothetical protein n=1 Tax=Halobacillus massiliensis TaxID=1926286 RepID=UPI0009E5B069|nr:hypothetical protein [Halobacillus massiliensis]
MYMKKVAGFILCSLFLFTFYPQTGYAHALEAPLSVQDQKIKDEIEQLTAELEEENISELHFVTGLDERLSKKPKYNKAKSQPVQDPSANDGENMLQILADTGATEWNSSIIEFAEELPVSQESKETLIKLFNYHVVSNVVVSSMDSDDVTEAMILELKEKGVTDDFAKTTSHTLVFLLL